MPSVAYRPAPRPIEKVRYNQQFLLVGGHPHEWWELVDGHSQQVRKSKPLKIRRCFGTETRELAWGTLVQPLND